jgi:hypothetical protein
MSAKADYERATANTGGVGMACHASTVGQLMEFEKAFRGEAGTAAVYIAELEAEIERLRAVLQEVVACSSTCPECTVAARAALEYGKDEQKVDEK